MGCPIPDNASVVSRFRLTGLAVIAGVTLVGATFYGIGISHHTDAIIRQILAPYSNVLAETGFAEANAATWARIAKQHRVAILVEPADAAPFAFDALGESLSPVSIPPSSTRRYNSLRTVRSNPNGDRATFFWTQTSSRRVHFSLLAGLLITVCAVMGTAFWFLQRQLKPLGLLNRGVDAVARGDLNARVPVVRADEIGRVAESFNKMTDRVREMIADRERLLVDVSHELRSPLARMKVALEFVDPGDKKVALVRDVREMEKLVAVLLEREALRSRAGRLAGGEIDLDAVARDVAASFANRAPGVELTSKAPVTMYADPVLLKLLIQNLVDNAVKFSRSDSRPVALELETDNDHVILRVVDDGIGIPAGQEERVCEPFVKLDKARGHGVGYGIGLNLCRRIVELHGGRLELLNRQLRGLEAVATLPRWQRRSGSQVPDDPARTH